MAIQHKTEAIVLKKRNLLNKDLIITFFTSEIGKISVFAKGVKKITSKRLPHLQTGNLLNIIIHQKDTVFYLNDTQLISVFSDIRKNEEKIGYRYLFFFILEKLLPENQKEEKIYELAKSFEVYLSKSVEKSKSLLDRYLNSLLMDLGYSQEAKPFDENVRIIQELIHEKLPVISI